MTIAWYDVIVGIAGVLTLGSRGLSFLINPWFCVRNAPRALRNASDLASALLGLRWLAGVTTDIPAGLWSAAITLIFGIISFAVICYHLYAIFHLGDRCPPEGQNAISAGR